jgi:hypothetical protein
MIFPFMYLLFHAEFRCLQVEESLVAKLSFCHDNELLIKIGTTCLTRLDIEALLLEPTYDCYAKFIDYTVCKAIVVLTISGNVTLVVTDYMHAL